ncbi:MAG: hypothetical protein ACFFG0_11700 [Candidatus Thorarchaeota archaeon]
MQGNIEINKKEGSVLVSVNPKIYPVDVVLSSAYIFTDSCYILVDGDPDKEITVELRPKNKKENIEKIGRNFNNELINYANYAVQAIKNERLREAILNRVLLTNSIEEPEEAIENEDYSEKEDEPWNLEDSEEIAVPWDEKYGESENEQGSYEKEQSFVDDPLGIAKPWDECYEETKNKQSDLEKEDEPWNFEDPEGIAIPWDEKYGKSKNKQSKE